MVDVVDVDVRGLLQGIGGFCLDFASWEGEESQLSYQAARRRPGSSDRREVAGQLVGLGDNPKALGPLAAVNGVIT